MAEPQLTIVILTRDEARHLERCLASVAGLPARVLIVDSGSTDATITIAEAAGARVLRHDWVNYARQFNWALDHGGIDTPWTMRLDADEVVEPALASAIIAFLAAPGDRMGAIVNRRVEFLGRTIRWGGVYPVPLLRLWRTGAGRCQDKWMDEHIEVGGPITTLDGMLADINLNNIGWWTEKHNRYASREAVDTLLRAAATGDGRPLRFRLYALAPPGLRPLLYFLWRYVARLGFLDGWQGLVFHVLQGFWYRFLVDVKVWELRRLMRLRGETLSQVAAAEYGLILDAA